MTVHAFASPRSLDEICDLNSGVSFPGATLEGCETALCLFAAAWWGRQDAYWIADAGLHGTCVDINGQRLSEMAEIYPSGWRFHQQDAFDYALYALGRKQWDVVTLDPFTSLVDRCAQDIGLWCQLARRLVVLGTLTDTEIEEPDGWTVTDIRKRSDHHGGVYWTVLEQA